MKSSFQKFFALALAFTLSAAVMQAQTVQDGLKMIQYEQFDKAIGIFENLAKANANSAEYQFYLGNAFSAAGKDNEALAAYNRAATLEPKGNYGIIANGRVQLLQKNFAEAKKTFESAVKQTRRKDAAIMRAAGESYLYADKTQIMDGINFLNEAVGVDNKNAFTYFSLGLAYRIINDGGKAVSNFEFASQNDPTNPVPYYKAAMIFKKTNKSEFVTRMEKTIALDANFAPAHLALGDYNYEQNQFLKAKDNYAKYMAIAANPTLDQRKQYANTLYLAKDYATAVQIINEVLKLDPNSDYLFRLLGYCYFETADYANGLSWMDKFFGIAKKDEVLASDYEYYYKLLQKNGKDSLAIVAMNQFLEKDPTHTELYKAIAESLYKSKKYLDAAKYYDIFIQKTGGNIQDFYDLGKSFYYGKEYGKADTAFSKVIEVKPDVPSAYLWRAKCNIKFEPDVIADPTLAPQFGKAKPYYEKFIELASGSKEKYKDDLIKAFEYMVYDAVLKEQTQGALAYCDRILEIDPANAGALDTKKAIEESQKVKKPK